MTIYILFSPSWPCSRFLAYTDLHVALESKDRLFRSGRTDIELRAHYVCTRSYGSIHKEYDVDWCTGVVYDDDDLPF